MKTLHIPIKNSLDPSIECRIYATELEMQAAIANEVIPAPADLKTVMAFTVCGFGHQIIYFSEEFLTLATIVHELTHAVSGYMASQGIRNLELTEALATPDEETFAELIGTVTERLQDKITATGLQFHHA